MKTFLRKKLFLILCLASLIYTLPAYNKYWAPLDEGIIAVAAQRLLAGELPYRDFFILMYPPGQIYVLALLFKIFSFSLIAGRVYTVFVSVGISMLAFYMALLLTGRLGVSVFSWLVVLVSLVPRLGAIPAPIWPGVLLSLLAIYVYMRYLAGLSYSHVAVVGFVSGTAILFRHDIGIFAAFSVFSSIFVGLFYNKRAARDMVFFITGVSIVILPCVVYFVMKSASGDMIDALIYFPFIHLKTAGLPFPKPCLDLNMIFHGSLQFININQYYIPILVYVFIFAYLLKAFVRRRLSDSGNMMVLPILLFGVLSFNQARIRTDPAHLLTVMQPAVILFGFIMHKALCGKSRRPAEAASVYIFSAVLLLLFALLSIKNIDKYFKNNFRKVWKKDIVKADFRAGSIYVPKEEIGDVMSTLDFINTHTNPGERIYIGNVAHWKDDFGGSTILYFLADRLPSTKYYEFVPGVMTNPDVQREIKDSLVDKGVNLLVLQDIDLGGLRREDAPEDKLILDDFIQENFERVKKFGKYNIYTKK
ncbi:MAG: hypothetical protein A2Z72_03010 [Omnitrophica bacterium RBG_13_46_9]|nr:MAG: hypothetical protein A2Z72_03010 [Omnitrophica bacterium RBG_13_46_9]